MAICYARWLVKRRKICYVSRRYIYMSIAVRAGKREQQQRRWYKRGGGEKMSSGTLAWQQQRVYMSKAKKAAR